MDVISSSLVLPELCRIRRYNGCVLRTVRLVSCMHRHIFELDWVIGICEDGIGIFEGVGTVVAHCRDVKGRSNLKVKLFGR